MSPNAEIAEATSFAMMRIVFDTARSFAKKPFSPWRSLFATRTPLAAVVQPKIRFVRTLMETKPGMRGDRPAAEDYRWSSAAAHVHGSPDPLLDPGLPFMTV